MFTAVWICHLHCAYDHIISKNAKIIMQVFGNGFVKDKKYDMRYSDLLLVHRPARLSRFWGHKYFAETWYSGCLNCSTASYSLEIWVQNYRYVRNTHLVLIWTEIQCKSEATNILQRPGIQVVSTAAAVASLWASTRSRLDFCIIGQRR